MNERTRFVWQVVSRMSLEGIRPTVRLVRRECGISSTSVADYHLRCLMKAGYLFWGTNKNTGRSLGGTIRPRILYVSAHLGQLPRLPLIRGEELSKRLPKVKEGEHEKDVGG